MPTRSSLPAAIWRMQGVGRLVVGGLWQVRWRLPGANAHERQRRVQRWARAVLAVLRVEVRSGDGTAPPIDTMASPGGPARGRLLVANHVSWLDIIVLLSLCPEARFLSKSDVRDWPAVGALVAGAGTLFIDRNSRRAVAQVRDELAHLLKEGATVAVFPEGTTTDGHAVLPFHAGLLHAAQQARATIEPLALRYADAEHAVSPHVPYIGDHSFVGSLWRLCRATGVVARVRWLPALDAGAPDRRSLADAARACIGAALQEDRGSDAPASAVRHRRAAVNARG